MKTCKKCGETKPTTDFYKNAKMRDGLYSLCIPCEKKRSSERYAANSENRKEYFKKRRVDNPEKIKAIEAKSRAANKEKVMARRAKWSKANRSRISAKNAEWHAANAERRNADNAKRRIENHLAYRIYKHARRAREASAEGRLSPGLHDRLMKAQRGKCVCCGKPLGTDYHLDHIMPLALGGSNTDDNIQLLRAKCNLQKNAKHPVDFMRQRGFLL